MKKLFFSSILVLGLALAANAKTAAASVMTIESEEINCASWAGSAADALQIDVTTVEGLRVCLKNHLLNTVNNGLTIS